MIITPQTEAPLHCYLCTKAKLFFDQHETNNIFLLLPVHYKAFYVLLSIRLALMPRAFRETIVTMGMQRTVQRQWEKTGRKRSKRGSKLPSTPESQFEGHLSFSSSAGLFVFSTELRFLPVFKWITRLEKGSDFTTYGRDTIYHKATTLFCTWHKIECTLPFFQFFLKEPI